MTKKLVIFNWKMNPQTLAEAKSLLSILNTKSVTLNTEYIICPPFIYMQELKNLKTKKFSNLKLGAQDVFYENPLTGGGAYTGEISPKMLKNLGVEYVIIGHSERRAIGETDEIINKKVLAALKAGLKVVLCVGEPKRELRIMNYELRLKKAQQFIKKQLEKDLKGVNHLPVAISHKLLIAYEPVWAISSSKNSQQDTPEDATEIVKTIKNFLHVSCRLSHVPVLYGGSVNSKDISDFINQPEIDGVLVGHASTDKKDVKKILKILNK